MTHGLDQFELTYEEFGFAKKVLEVGKAWKQTCRMNLAKYIDNVTPRYLLWRSNRVKDLILPLEKFP